MISKTKNKINLMKKRMKRKNQKNKQNESKKKLVEPSRKVIRQEIIVLIQIIVADLFRLLGLNLSIAW
jgi:hypothetical protein